MAQAGCQLHADLTALAVMWFLRVLLNLHKFLALAGRADRYFRHHRPDAVVLIDYPGFNWWIARRAKAHGIPVFYYRPAADLGLGQLADQEDAPLRGPRAVQLAVRGPLVCRARLPRHVRRPSLFRRSAPAAARRSVSWTSIATPSGRWSRFCPGSRTQEVAHNLKYFLQAARLIRAQMPQVRFAIAASSPTRPRWPARPWPPADCRSTSSSRRTPELIHLADCCLAVSGSVSLELLYQTKPTVILYWITPLAFAVQKRFRKVKYITLVNLLADRRVVSRAIRRPSIPTRPSRAGAVSRIPDLRGQVAADRQRTSIDWLTNRPSPSSDWSSDWRELKAEVGHGGASSQGGRLHSRSAWTVGRCPSRGPISSRQSGIVATRPCSPPIAA